MYMHVIAHDIGVERTCYHCSKVGNKIYIISNYSYLVLLICLTVYGNNTYTYVRMYRLLEINGEDISNSNTKQVVSLLKNLHESMQFVLLRAGPCSVLEETDATNESTVKRLQELNATLTKQVEKQMSETQYWRNQYEQ